VSTRPVGKGMGSMGMRRINDTHVDMHETINVGTMEKEGRWQVPYLQKQTPVEHEVAAAAIA